MWFSFAPLSQHIKTEYHLQYMVNDEHYKELRSVIDSLPSWTSLNDVQRQPEDSSDQESELESGMDSELSSSDDDDDEEEDEEGDEEDEAEDEEVNEGDADENNGDDDVRPPTEKRKATALEDLAEKVGLIIQM